MLLFCFSTSALAQELQIPARAVNAPDGDTFAVQISALDLCARDAATEAEFLAGNAPDFLRKLCSVTVTNVVAGATNTATFFVTPDYLAIGSDENYFLTPVSPATAQRIADKLNCILPTRKMVNAIYATAGVKLPPSPISPGPTMTTVPVFVQHNETIRTQRTALTNAYPLGALVAGHKKDVVISTRLAAITNRVAIYGWHRTNGVPIQPLYLGHVIWWVDYSQCVRLISQIMIVNGQKRKVADVLADPNLCQLISDEGIVTNTRYPTNAVTTPEEKVSQSWPAKFVATTHFDEWQREINLPDGVRILINAPSPGSFSRQKPVMLVFYALPNGNTTEQTFGKNMQPGDDWHFDIQHIGAQTRWLRQIVTNESMVVAYLESTNKSWPAWRKQHSDARIVEITDEVRGIFSSNEIEVVLASHSGGGSFVFGYLNAVKEIPADVRRIAFLDSDYAYASNRHAKEINQWLCKSPENHLCVLGYEDYVALLDGKTFVSENGGTWGRSHAWLKDLSTEFRFNSQTNDGLECSRALDGRIEFLLKENPEKKILHTIQVERNGFIQAMLSGTPSEGKGYEYFKDRVYSSFIE